MAVGSGVCVAVAVGQGVAVGRGVLVGGAVGAGVKVAGAGIGVGVAGASASLCCWLASTAETAPNGVAVQVGTGVRVAEESPKLQPALMSTTRIKQVSVSPRRRT